MYAADTQHQRHRRHIADYHERLLRYYDWFWHGRTGGHVNAADSLDGGIKILRGDNHPVPFTDASFHVLWRLVLTGLTSYFAVTSTRRT